MRPGVQVWEVDGPEPEILVRGWLDERAAALWVRGVAEYRLKDTAAARRTFESLIKEFPDGDLTEGEKALLDLLNKKLRRDLRKAA